MPNTRPAESASRFTRAFHPGLAAKLVKVGALGKVGLGRTRRSDEPALDRAMALVREARRPVVIAGHGARPAQAQVQALAEQLGAPVLTTFKAKGLISDTIRWVPGCWAAAAPRSPAG